MINQHREHITSPPNPCTMCSKNTYKLDMINRGWISKWRSSYSSPVVCVRKKDGSLRMCVDYPQLNSNTRDDHQPIHRIQGVLNSRSSNTYFTVLDQVYHQGFVAEEHCHRTAFITPWSLYQWKHIPFGLKNDPVAYQRYMQNWVQLFEGRLVLNPELNLTRVSFSYVQKHLLG